MREHVATTAATTPGHSPGPTESARSSSPLTPLRLHFQSRRGTPLCIRTPELALELELARTRGLSDDRASAPAADTAGASPGASPWPPPSWPAWPFRGRRRGLLARRGCSRGGGRFLRRGRRQHGRLARRGRRRSARSALAARCRRRSRRARRGARAGAGAAVVGAVMGAAAGTGDGRASARSAPAPPPASEASASARSSSRTPAQSR